MYEYYEEETPEGEIDISELVGKTLVDIEQIQDDEVIFTTDNGERYRLFHEQECCEGVYIVDVCGEYKYLLNAPILLAECVTNCNNRPQLLEEDEWTHASFLWTFYKLSTIQGSVTIRWYGHSNGYYAVNVDFEKITH